MFVKLVFLKYAYYIKMPCTAPLNIVQKLQTEKTCNLKCAYKFTYTPSALKITNVNVALIMGVDPPTTPPVIFNDENYSVGLIVLFQPSLHSYNGSNADAELIIQHTATNSSGKVLYVCVPIKASSTSTALSSNYFDMIMAEVSQSANTNQSATTFNNSSFNLGIFVPMTPYYSYVGTDIFNTNQCDDTDSNIDYVVYHADNAITMSPSALRTLQSVIPVDNKTVVGKAMDESVNIGGVFYNSNGPSSSAKPDIYIDCQLVGEDGEVLVPIKPDSTKSLLDIGILNKIFGSDFIMTSIKIIVGIILMIVLWKLMLKIVQGISASAVKPKPVAPNATT